jgi:hypothetical protein
MDAWPPEPTGNRTNGACHPVNQQLPADDLGAPWTVSPSPRLMTK